MSDTPIQEDLPVNTEPSTKEPKAKTAKKKVAKKAAKKAAKKTVTKKATAKKTAKKAAKKATVKPTPQAEATPEPVKVEPIAAPAAEKPAKELPPVAQTPSSDDHTEQPKAERVEEHRSETRHPRQNQRENDQGENGRRNNQGRNQQRQKGGHKNNRDRHQNNNQKGKPQREQRDRQPRERRPKKEIVLTGDPVQINGMLEIAPKGFGFLRVPTKNFEQCKEDVFVTPDTIRKHGLRAGVWIHGNYQEGPRGPQLVSINKINDIAPEDAFKLPHFEELKAVNPNRRIAFETTPDRYTTRVLDIVAPVGRGQRGLIVSPPRSGKTTLLLHMAEAVREQYDESIHLIILLIDERPEEVTEFRRMLPGVEIYASSNDDPAKNHARLAELCIERAKRLVEGGTDVLILMDSITRLARAYNNGSGNNNQRGKKNNKRGYQSGGIVAGALEAPRRIFAAARNTRTAGSLTILATALVQTNSRADEAIFQEFKGTGNMELVLDRRIAEQYIYPAVDIFKSATRREELIMADHLLQKINLIRRGLKGHRPEEAMERLLFFLKKFPNNAQMLMEIKG